MAESKSGANQISNWTQLTFEKERKEKEKKIIDMLNMRYGIQGQISR